MKIQEWMETLLTEKGIDVEAEVIEVEGESGMNYIEMPCLIQAIKNATIHEQAQIKDTLVKIDFLNGDVMHFFRHLAQAIAI